MKPSLYSVAIFVNDIGRAVEFYRDTFACRSPSRAPSVRSFWRGRPTSEFTRRFTPKPDHWWAGTPG
jgi:predicted enzyme related to lactoylglutathione lyase